MKEAEIQFRKETWQYIQELVSKTRKDYCEARRSERSYLKKIGPIVRRSLPTIHYQVLKMRCDGLNLEEIGKKLGVTRERIRQIEARTTEHLALKA